jgi:hypothetical protein
VAVLSDCFFVRMASFYSDLLGKEQKSVGTLMQDGYITNFATLNILHSVLIIEILLCMLSMGSLMRSVPGTEKAVGTLMESAFIANFAILILIVCVDNWRSLMGSEIICLILTKVINGCHTPLLYLTDENLYKKRLLGTQAVFASI